MTKRKRTTG